LPDLAENLGGGWDGELERFGENYPCQGEEIQDAVHPTYVLSEAGENSFYS